MAKHISGITANDMTFKARVRSRHMLENSPYLEYPYLDDGMLLWEAILD